jgi:isopentenyl-diphosphate delta-isomerase
MQAEEHVILVDHKNQMLGTMEKMEAHSKGKLHRAFSTFIFNTQGQLLLQQRAINKYHSGAKWTNTCCSHPRPGEAVYDAANRRLSEEMGLVCKLRPVFDFVYHAELAGGLIEYEYDHVLFGVTDAVPKPNKDEVIGYEYCDVPSLESDLHNNPAKYTEWLKICLGQVKRVKNSIQF